MSPALPDLLAGLVAAMTAPAPPEAGGDYAAARVGLISSLLILAAQEADQGPGARRWENETLAGLLVETAPAYGEVLAPHLHLARTPAPADLGWRALDTRNAGLRRGLIALHEAAEARGDKPLQTRVLALYQEIAARRRLVLPLT